MAKIPVVDFKQAQSRNINDRRRAGQQIVEGLHTYGIYHLENHGIADGLREKFFEGLRVYACLPEETRRGHVLQDSWGQRGWAEGEKSVTEEGLDFKGWWFANPALLRAEPAPRAARRRGPTD